MKKELLNGFKPLSKTFKQKGELYIRVQDENCVYISNSLLQYLGSKYIIILVNEKEHKIAFIPCKKTDKNAFLITDSRKLCNKNLINLLEPKIRYIGECLKTEKGIIFNI